MKLDFSRFIVAFLILAAIMGCSEKQQINSANRPSVDAEIKSKMSLVLICIATEKLVTGKSDLEAVAVLEEAKRTYLQKNLLGISLTEKNISIVKEHGVEGLLFLNRKALLHKHFESDS